jgi:hypothetical protein
MGEGNQEAGAEREIVAIIRGAKGEGRNGRQNNYKRCIKLGDELDDMSEF